MITAGVGTGARFGSGNSSSGSGKGTGGSVLSDAEGSGVSSGGSSGVGVSTGAGNSPPSLDGGEQAAIPNNVNEIINSIDISFAIDLYSS